MTERTIAIATWLQTSGVAFGTSGARGLVADMRDEVCFAYVLAFLEHLRDRGLVRPGSAVALAGDRRDSTPRILAAVASAVRHAGHEPCFGGTVPTPAIAAFALQRSIAAIMVTGSHIPDDRNGIKFYRPDGEILKDDEDAIASRTVTLPDRFDDEGALCDAEALPEADPRVVAEYRERWRTAFGEDALAGCRIGLYGHSAVGREIIEDVLRDLGATVTRLGFSKTFVAVDTEAVRPTDIALAKRWAKDHRFDAIVSTDGDGDRPLVADEVGRWLRGDLVGVLCARHLGARVVVTPLSSSTIVERCRWFDQVDRTRIGSPYVVQTMQARVAEGRARVAGYEANGGFLSATPLPAPAGELPALPTRDAMPVILAVLHAAARRGMPISALAAELPARFTFSDRLPGLTSARAHAHLHEVQARGHAGIAALFGAAVGEVDRIDTTDGLRVIFRSGDIVHLRPSGNAPELRCYTEAATEARARDLAAMALAAAASWT